jgi:hypothetical protein
LLQLVGVDGREFDGELVAGGVQGAFSGPELDDAVTVAAFDALYLRRPAAIGLAVSRVAADLVQVPA